jgi:hypothetical protein
MAKQHEAEQARAAELRRMAEALESKAADLRIAEQLEALRVSSAAQAAELEEKQRRADEEYKTSLKEMSSKLEAERRQLRLLERQLEQAASAASRARVLSILEEGAAFPLGMVEVPPPHGERTLAELRLLLRDEIDELAEAEFLFLSASGPDGQGQRAPLSSKQEARKTLADLPANEPVFIRFSVPAAAAAAATTAVAASSVPVAPAFVVPDAPPAPPAAPAFTASLSVSTGAAAAPARADLLGRVRAGASLKKAVVSPKPAAAASGPMAMGGGLSGLLSAALANRRTNLDDDDAGGRKRADSWDFD